MGYALYRKDRILWAAGTHEYRPMGAAVIAVTDQFRRRDFSHLRRRPKELDSDFVGFFGSLEDLNARLRTESGRLRTESAWKRRTTPGHLR